MRIVVHFFVRPLLLLLFGLLARSLDLYW